MTSLKHSDVTVVIPAFNEADAIGSVIDEVKNAVPEINILVINDCSEDETGEIAEKHGAEVIHHDFNRGYGASLKTGTLRAKTPFVLFFDADGQHDPSDIKRLIEASGDYDMVVGARTKKSYAPVLRRPGKFILRHFADYLADQKLPDFNSGLRIVRRKVLLAYLHLMPNSFSFSTTINFALLKSNHSVHWIPIEVRKRVGSSTVSQIRHGSSTLLLMLRLSVLFEPLRIFLTIAASTAALTVGSIVIDILSPTEKGIGDVTVMLSIATLTIFLIGLLCDQVSSVRRELHETRHLS